MKIVRGMPNRGDHYSHWERYLAYISDKYGITREMFWDRWRKQGGRCAICRRAVRLVTDHDHKTGRFRGLLCYYCNGILGKVEKLPRILKNIPLYLKAK